MIAFWKWFSRQPSKKSAPVPQNNKTMPSVVKYQAGDIYSFKTSPTNKFSDQDTGRYACLKILMPVECLGELNPSLIGFVVLDKIFDHSPTIPELDNAAPLMKQSFDPNNKHHTEQKALEISHKYAVCSTPDEWGNDLLEFSLIGNIKLSSLEEEMRQDLRCISTWCTATHDAEKEWRLKHDKQRLFDEVDKEKLEQQTKDKAAKEREESRLSTLTWAQVEKEVYFKRWNESPPFPSKKFTKEMRNLVKHSIADLQALGTKPSRPKVRKILKNLVDEIAKLNEKYDWVIETEEREDIYEVFYDLTHLTKQKILIDEIGDWHYLKW